MRVSFRSSFANDLKGVKDKSLLRRVKEMIEAVENAASLDELHGLKKLKGGGITFASELEIIELALRWRPT